MSNTWTRQDDNAGQKRSRSPLKPENSLVPVSSESWEEDGRGVGITSETKIFSLKKLSATLPSAVADTANKSVQKIKDQRPWIPLQCKNKRRANWLHAIYRVCISAFCWLHVCFGNRPRLFFLSTLPVKRLDTYFWVNGFSFIFTTIYIVGCPWRHPNYEWTHMEYVWNKKVWKNTNQFYIWDDLE